jgi:hypothetical protein
MTVGAIMDFNVGEFVLRERLIAVLQFRTGVLDFCGFLTIWK